VRAATGKKGALYMPCVRHWTGVAHGPELAPLWKAMPPGKARSGWPVRLRIMIRIHNSMTGESSPWSRSHRDRVRMYVCGITVYDYIHIGHARMLTVFDVVNLTPVSGTRSPTSAHH